MTDVNLITGTGTGRADNIRGTDGADVVLALNGADTVRGMDVIIDFRLGEDSPSLIGLKVTGVARGFSDLSTMNGVDLDNSARATDLTLTVQDIFGPSQKIVLLDTWSSSNSAAWTAISRNSATAAAPTEFLHRRGSGRAQPDTNSPATLSRAMLFRPPSLVRQTILIDRSGRPSSLHRMVSPRTTGPTFSGVPE
ncbi:MAG: hypothetical protein NTZ14_10180 [Hyphomicrobiales bacterium]|nr:hypothetical protein [Hyphomicrobiales bacterium]